LGVDGVTFVYFTRPVPGEGALRDHPGIRARIAAGLAGLQWWVSYVKAAPTARLIPPVHGSRLPTALPPGTRKRPLTDTARQGLLPDFTCSRRR
jgi:hypothetical protein